MATDALPARSGSMERRGQALLSRAGSVTRVHEVLGVAATQLPTIIPHSSSVWMAADPATGLPSSPAVWDGGGRSALGNGSWQREVGGAGVADFVSLGRASPSARVHRVGERMVRAVLSCDDVPWALASLRRSPREEPFSRDETRVLSELAEPLGRLVRHRVRAGFHRAPRSQIVDSPGLLLFDDRLELVSAGGDWDAWLSALGDDVHVANAIDVPVPMWIVAAAGHALRSARARGSGQTTVRAVTRYGHWVVAQATVTRDGSARADHVAVSVEAARAAALTPIVVAAHGISSREREVMTHLVAGAGTADIAMELRISRHTVRDHVKSILQKAGVSSRAELVALLLGAAGRTTIHRH